MLFRSNQAFAAFHRYKRKEDCSANLNSYRQIMELRTPEGVVLPPDQWLLPRALRGESGTDEEFLLRATMPAGQVDAMRSAGPARRDYFPLGRPVLRLIEEITRRKDLHDISVERKGFRLQMRRLAKESC